MLEYLSDIRFCSALRGCGDGTQHYTIFMSHLLCKLSGSTRYRQAERELVSRPGDVLLIPRGSEFDAEILEPGEYVILYFDSAEPIPTELQCFPALPGAARAFLSALSLWNGRDATSFFFCQSRLYEIVGQLAVCLQEGSVPLPERMKIESSVRYLQTHFCDPAFSMQEMYRLSGISETYFRQIFRRVYDMSPKRYLVRARISRAEGLLLSEPSCRVGEVAAAVGYTDVYLFSRTFRQETGVSPSRYAAQFLENF